MPDINNAVALGVAPVQQPDIVGPIAKLAQLQYLSANADKVKAETGQIGLNTQFAVARQQSLRDFNDRRSRGEDVPTALSNSGVAAYDPTAANAILGNVKTGNELTAIKNYKPGDPTSLAAGGPEMVGKEAANLSTVANTVKTGVETRQAQTQLYGQVGTVMASDPSPQGRAVAANIARQAGVPEPQIQQFMQLPDDKYMLAGKHLQQAAITPDKYMELSGEAARNKGIAEAQTAIKSVGPTDQLYMGPAARQAFTGTAPNAGVVGQPSLGNFAPPSAPSLSGPTPDRLGAGGTPTPSAAAASGIGLATPGQMARPTNVRNVNAVATPSVGVSVPQAVTDAASKYGISPNYLGRTYQIESGGNVNAYNSASKAAGPFQFVPSTGAKYLNGKSPFDLAASADAAARLAADNKASLTQALGRVPTDAELYLAHQQGASGAAKLLANPNARAGDLVGNSAVASNGGNPNAPASAFTNLWAAKFNGGVGKSIPQAAVAPSITPASTANVPNIPGSVAPVAAAALAPPALPTPAAPPQGTVAPIAPAPPVIQTPTAPLATPTVNAPLSPVVAGMGPAALHEQEGYGTALGKLPEELDKAAAAAKTTNATLDEMSTAAQNFRLGKWSDHEQSLREGLQAAATVLGVKNPDLERATGSYQDLAKLSGQVVRQAAHELGSRTGVQELQMITKTNPNAEMTEQGFSTAVSQMKGLNDFAIAKQQAGADWRAANNGSMGPDKSGKDFLTTWNAQASPTAFVIHRMQEENPATLQNLVSTLSKTPEGKKTLENIRTQIKTANDNGWLGK